MRQFKPIIRFSKKKDIYYVSLQEFENIIKTKNNFINEINIIFSDFNEEYFKKLSGKYTY